MKSPLNHRANNKKAFTLIEVLVVITIMAVLIAMLFPALGRMRDSANRAKCASNLRSIGTLMHAYLNDNNGIFPYAVSTETGRSWDYELLLYATDEANAQEIGLAGKDPYEAFACPSAHKPARSIVSASSYAINQELVGIYTSSMDSAPERTRLVNVARPSQTYLAVDSDEREFRRATQNNFTRVRYGGKSAVDRHNGKLNMLFVDGSVQPLDFESIPWGNDVPANEAPWGPE